MISREEKAVPAITRGSPAGAALPPLPGPVLALSRTSAVAVVVVFTVSLPARR
jgi:hypothetical protein